MIRYFIEREGEEPEETDLDIAECLQAAAKYRPYLYSGVDVRTTGLLIDVVM